MSAVRPGSVLFVCTGNSVRSPMAAALARHHFGRWLRVASVGVAPRLVDPFAVAVMAELGLDISLGQPHGLDAVVWADFDLIISLTPEGRHHALQAAPGAVVEHWPIPDPTFERDLGRPRDQVLMAYRAVRDELEARMVVRFAKGPGSSS